MPYINKGRFWTYGVKTRDEVDALTGMSTGDTVFCSTFKRPLTYDGELWMCNDFVKLKSAAVVTLVPGDMVRVAAGASGRCEQTTNASEIKAQGIVVWGGADGDKIGIAIGGIYESLSNTAPSIGYMLISDATDGEADATSGSGVGRFGNWLEATGAGGTAMLWLKPGMEFN